MKMLRAVFLLFFVCGSLYAEDFFIIRQDRFFRTEPVLQYWSMNGGDHFSELSSPFFLYMPFGYYLGLNVQTSPAMVNGNTLEKLSGMTDVQLGLSYHLERYNTVVNVGVNIPSGKKELTSAQFQTSHLASLYQFDLRTPNFGQGLNLSGGLTWARPFGSSFVFGLGAAYQVRGSYKPIQGMLFDYDPGDEILLTSGFDVKMDETSSFTFDFIFTSYGTDLIGDDKAFASGKKIVLNFKYEQYFGYNELLVFARYRSKDKNQIAIAGQLFQEEEKSIPNQLELWGLYKHRFSPELRLGFLLEGRHIAESTAFTSTDIFGAGLLPEYQFSSAVRGLGHLKALLAQTEKGHDLFGFEIGAGMEVKF